MTKATLITEVNDNVEGRGASIRTLEEADFGQQNFKSIKSQEPIDTQEDEEENQD